MVAKQRVRSRAECLAESHWEWLEEILHKVYVDAMMHGYKHGEDDKEKEIDGMSGY